MPPEKFKAEVISLGRITIPKTVRVLLEIKDGDIVEVTIQKVLVPNEILDINVEVPQIERT